MVYHVCDVDSAESIRARTNEQMRKKEKYALKCLKKKKKKNVFQCRQTAYCDIKRDARALHIERREE